LTAGGGKADAETPIGGGNEDEETALLAT